MIGIDIPISRFEAFAPRNQLGPLGKSFAVNENGFLIFHPSLWTVSNYLEDPAHNDLEDIEGDSEAISSLRKAMIDLATSQDQRAEVQRLTIPDSSVILNEGHSKSLNMSFYFTSVPKTRFALAVVLPEFWQYIQVPEQIDAPDILNRMLKVFKFSCACQQLNFTNSRPILHTKHRQLSRFLGRPDSSFAQSQIL